MSQLKELMVLELQYLLYAENELVVALPDMAAAAHHPKLKEALEKHLQHTRNHVERIEQAFAALGEEPQSRPCKAVMGLIEAGKEVVEEGKSKEDFVADLALIGAAQKVEHYEISAYGTLRCLARQVGEVEVATLLSHSLGEEESADYLLTEIAKPILQEALSQEWELTASSTGSRSTKS